MKKVLFIMLIASVAFSSSAFMSPEELLPFHLWTVLFKPAGDVSDLQEVVDTYNGEVFTVGRTLGIYGMKFDPPVDLTAMIDAREAGDRETYWRLFDIAADYIYDIIHTLEATNKVEFAQPNWCYYIQYIPNDPLFINPPDISESGPPNQFGLYLMDADAAWAVTHGSEDVVIAILDSGVDVLNPDLEGNIWVNPGEDLNGNGVVWDVEDLDGIDNDGNGYIDDLFGYDFSGGNTGDETDDPTEHDWNPAVHTGDDGWGEPDPSIGNGRGGGFLMPADAGVYHGTHCAGIASAVTDNALHFAGAGFNSKIMPVRVGHANGGMYANNIVEGIQYATIAGADVISMSLGGLGGSDPAGEAALRAAYEAGIPIVAASGNMGAFMPVAWPASSEYTLAVGSGTSGMETSSFTQTGARLDVLAPGGEASMWTGVMTEGIWSHIIYSVAAANEDPSIEPGDRDIKIEVGTSMACPYAAGLVALIQSVVPDTTSPEHIYNIVKHSATNMYGPGRDDRSGYGMINFAAAIELAMGDGVVEKGVPRNMKIGSVYPNPFNARATIDVEALTDEEATIQVLDLGGRVLSATDVSLNAGKNFVSVPACGLNSGVYLVRVRTENELATRRMVLVK